MSTIQQSALNLWRPFRAGPGIGRVVVNWYGLAGDALRDHLRGAPVFLVCGGPSLNETDLGLLNQRGVIVAAVNQAAATHVRPQISITVDPPRKFHSAIWKDPAVLKLTRRVQSRDRITEPAGSGWTTTGPKVRDLPNVWFYEHSYGFTPDDFLTRPRIAWGADFKTGGGVRSTRNVMIAAMRLLYWLGARTVFLVGADFQMQAGRSYAFDDPKDARAAGTNNNSFGILNRWFHALGPHFEKHDFRVVNVTPGSHLDAFDRMDYTTAVAAVAAGVPPVDSVRGLYRL